MPVLFQGADGGNGGGGKVVRWDGTRGIPIECQTLTKKFTQSRERKMKKASLYHAG